MKDNKIGVEIMYNPAALKMTKTFSSFPFLAVLLPELLHKLSGTFYLAECRNLVKSFLQQVLIIFDSGQWTKLL